MPVRGIRGAINIASNTKDEILSKSRELLEAIAKANKVKPDDIACAIFTLSPDLNADFPAYAARQMGWPHLSPPRPCTTSRRCRENSSDGR